MHALELKVPPPVLALLIAALMSFLSAKGSTLPLPDGMRSFLELLLVAFGVGIAVAGVLEFRRADTTISPLRPDSSRFVVQRGVYAYTRNPMYLGLTSVLLAWGIHLASLLALLGPVLFMLYLTRFQIVPEERTLAAAFPADYPEYKKRVRRWF